MTSGVECFSPKAPGTSGPSLLARASGGATCYLVGAVEGQQDVVVELEVPGLQVPLVRSRLGEAVRDEGHHVEEGGHRQPLRGLPKKEGRSGR